MFNRITIVGSLDLWRFMKIQEVHSWKPSKTIMELENRCFRKTSLFKGSIFTFYVSFQGYIPSKNALETANRKHNVYWAPVSGTTSPQPFRRSHVRFVTDVDGVFTKRLVSSGNFGCWCEMLIRGPFPTDGILFLREFGVEVLSILINNISLSLSIFRGCPVFLVWRLCWFCNCFCQT